VTKKVETKAEAGAKPAKKPALTARQWAEAVALWENGAVTLPELAKKYDRHEQSFVQYFRRRGIKKGSKLAKIATKVDKKVEEQHINDAEVIAARIRETKEEHYKMAAGLAKLTWAEVLKAKQDGVPVGTAINNLKALESAMNVLKKAREERYSVLGLDRADSVDENEVPELVISELTADQIETLRQRSFRELQDIDDQISEMQPDEEADDDGVVEES
jgi:hypothetical protein